MPVPSGFRAPRLFDYPVTREAGPEQSGEYGFSCRVYDTEEGLMGWPTVKMVRDQLRSRLVSKATV